MAPPTTSSPSSFGGSVRPSHVSTLSNKVQGLKFMQRAAALNPPTEAATPASPSGSRLAQGSPAPASASTSTTVDGPAKRGTKEPKIVFEDGNEEHWSFADPSTSAATTSDPQASSSSGSGWNSWLLQASSSSSKGKHRGAKSSHSEPASSSFDELGPVGRRKFGTFEGEEKKEIQGGSKKKDVGSTPAEGGAEREKAGKKRPSTSREWSLEPDLDVDQDSGYAKGSQRREERREEDVKSIRGNSGAARYHRGDQTGARQEGKKAKKARKSADDPGASPKTSRPIALVDYMASSDEEGEESGGGPDTQARTQVQQPAETAPEPHSVIKAKTRRTLPSVSFSPSPSARTFTSEKIVPGEWLCHVYVAIPLAKHPKLATFLKKAKAVLLSNTAAAENFVWSMNDDASSQEDSNLHVSLTQPILIRAHEKDSFLREAKSILQRQSSFALSFSTFSPLASSPLTSVHPPRVYYTLEVGLGHAALQTMSRALGGMVRTLFQGKTYFEEQGGERFHASWGYEQLGVQDEASVSAEQMQMAEQRTRKLEREMGDRVRALGEVRVRGVEVKVGKQISRVPLK